MSLPRPTGLKAPSKISRPSTSVPRPSGIPAPGSGSGSRAQSPEPSAQPGGTDDFKIGDRVWVSGTKPGVIAFIGEAQFAPGEWAGVALDEPIGKNDGSVAGVRYFQCEPMKGVFSRLSKLSRAPGGAPAQKHTDGSSDGHSNSTSQSSSVHNGSVNHTPARSQTPRIGLSGSRSKSGSNVSLNKDSPPASTTNLHRGGLAMTKHGVKLGDRVIVSGTKTGILRYVGQTDFAKGEWAGVELEEPQGKNDGAVAGKRYFDCRPNYGLFAPIHKVARFTVGATPSPQSRSLANTSLRSARERSGSQESISSVSSTASSVSRSRASKTGQRPSTLNLSATTSALQKALKEKEEHIEQLLRERDLERAEVARAAAQADEAEGALASVRHDREMMAADSNEQIRQMREIILGLEKEKKQLAVKLEEEKRKVEDLQFQIEEEVISKDDLECRTEEDEEKLRSLERNHKKEKERADKFERELNALKDIVNQQQTKLKQADDTQTTYLDQMEELTYKLNQAENKIKTFEASRLEEGAKTSQVSMELDEKSNRVTELEEALTAQRKEIKQLQDKLVEVTDDLTDTNNKKQKMQDTITDLQRQLATSKEKVDELTDDRNKLEAQLSDLMKNSGDSSKQLSLMNDQVAEKTRKIEELQSDLSSSTQKVAILNETIEQLKLDGEKEKEDIVNRSREEVKATEAKLEDVQTELGRTKAKIDKLTEYSEKEKVELEEKRDLEIAELKKQLAASAEELEKQEVQTQAHKQVLDQITLERETMKFEKEKAEKNLKRTESEKDAINTELVQTRVELSKLQAESQQSSTVKQTMEEQVQIAHEDRDRALKAKEELQKQFQDAQTEKEKVISEKNQLQQDAMVTKADIQKKDIQIDELQKEVEKLKSETVNQQQELMQKSQSESDNGALSRNLEETKKQLSTVQATLREAEAEKLKMTTELQQSQLVKEERKKLEEQNKHLQTELQENTKRFSDEKSSLEASNAALQSKVDNSSKDLADLQRQLEENTKKVHDLQNENLSLSSFKASASKLEEQQTSEKNKLLDKVHSLEAMVKESQKNANNIAVTSGDPEVAQLKADKESSEKQVEFLNTVIVELQRKNDELQVRLQAMEAGVFDNGDAVEGMDISPSRPRSAPRLFCDICDMFDLHDTDDCPKQAMSESPPASHYHGDRKQTRPYCDICEEDTRHVEGMSDPETADSPRVTSLPDVPEEDVTALKKWEEGPITDRMLQVPTVPKRSAPGKKTNTVGFTKNTKPAECIQVKEPYTGGHGAASIEWSNPAQMKSKLADELGCDEDDIGDVPLISLQRLLSSDSTEDYPTDTIRLQQAIFKADKAIQKQSLWGDSDGMKELPTSVPDIGEKRSNRPEIAVADLSKKDESVGSKDNILLDDPSKDNILLDNQTPGKSQLMGRGEAVELPHLCPSADSGNDQKTSGRGDVAQASTDDAGNDQDNSDMKISDICSTSSGFGSGGLMEGLENLDYPDWYNDECDAEVASLELGQKEEPERKESNGEDEELKMFEELEAELAKEDDPEDTNVIKEEMMTEKVDELESCCDEVQPESCLTDTKNDNFVATEIQTNDNVADVANTTSGQTQFPSEARPTLGAELKMQGANTISEIQTENNPSDVPTQHSDDRTATDDMAEEGFEEQSQESHNNTNTATSGENDTVNQDRSNDPVISDDQDVTCRRSSSLECEGNSGLNVNKEVTQWTDGPDQSESKPTEDEIVIGTEAVGWTRGQGEPEFVTSATPDIDEFFEANTSMTADDVGDMSSITSCTSHVTDEPASSEVEQVEGTLQDEFETPPSGSPPCVTPQHGTSPCPTPLNTASPCVTPPQSVSPSVTQSSSSSPCGTPPRSPTPPMVNPGENPSPQTLISDSDADVVMRRSKKGRSSPTMRSSVPTCPEPQPSNGKGKTESCIVS